MSFSYCRQIAFLFFVSLFVASFISTNSEDLGIDATGEIYQEDVPKPSIISSPLPEAVIDEVTHTVIPNNDPLDSSNPASSKIYEDKEAADRHDHSHHHGHHHSHNHHHSHSHHHHASLSDENRESHTVLAITLTFASGLAATFGGLIVIVCGIPSPTALGHLLSFASGIMMYISFGDLLKHSEADLGSMSANIWMFAGMIFFWLVVTFVPEPELNNDPSSQNTQDEKTGSSRRLYMTGLIAALGISLHNFPEGLIVYSQTIGGICDTAAFEGISWSDLLSGTLPAGNVLQAASTCMTRGLAVTMAIALHNIPEGMAVASPIYASSGSKWEAMKWCLISSLCEPAAALLLVPFNHLLTAGVTAALNAMVAGIMIMLCIIELIPAATQHLSGRAAALSNICGMALMFVSIEYMVSNDIH